MFTGLIEEVGNVLRVTGGDGTTRLVVSSNNLIQEMRKGDSIAVSGVCLTAVELKPDRIGFSPGPSVALSRTASYGENPPLRVMY